jgi:hypothetical protein
MTNMGMTHMYSLMNLRIPATTALLFLTVAACGTGRTVKRAGEACKKDSDCEFLLCDKGRCSTVCSVDSDCPEGMSCNATGTGDSATSGYCVTGEVPSTDACRTNNGGCDPLTTCTSTADGRTCGACPSGYTGTGATSCIDIDECQTDNGGCDPLTTCTNAAGTRICGACPSGYTGSGQTSCLPSCSTSQNTNTRCQGTATVETCNGSAWIKTADCVAPEVCLLTSSTLAECKVPRTEFEPCTGAGKGDCADGLTCGLIDLLSLDDMCYIDCTSNPSICPSTSYCDPGFFEGLQYSDSPFCFPKGDRDDLCLFTDNGCKPSAPACLSIVTHFNPECKVPCDGGTVGTTGTCTGGDTCLEGPFPEMQDSGGAPKACTNVGTTDVCNAAGNYTCQNIRYGDADIRKECARKFGVCGTPTTIAPDFASDAAVGTFLADASNLCNRLNADTYCPALATGLGVATMECIGTDYAIPYDPPISCDPLDLLSCFGGGVCASMHDNEVFECTIPANVCVIYCTAMDGTEGLTCPAPRTTCGAPTYTPGLGGYAFERGVGGGYVTCDSDANCKTSAGFSCRDDVVIDLRVCALTRKICK